MVSSEKGWGVMVEIEDKVCWALRGQHLNYLERDVELISVYVPLTRLYFSV